MPEGGSTTQREEFVHPNTDYEFVYDPYQHLKGKALRTRQSREEDLAVVFLNLENPRDRGA